MTKKSIYEELEQKIEKLEKSEIFSQMLFEKNTNPIAVIDRKGIYLDANQAFLEFVEINRQQLLKMSVFDFSPPDKQNHQKTIHQQIWENGGTLETEYFVKGDIKILELTVLPIHHEGIDAIMGLGKDITERKQAEEALRKSEERYRLHFENVLDVIYTVDSEFKMLDVSPSVEKLLGYKPKELIGRPFQDLNLLAPEYLEQAFSESLRVLKGERITSTVYQFIARDGTKKWGEISGAPVIRDNKVVAITSVARDITERKRAEEERDKLIAELQKTLSEIKTLRGFLPICSHCKKIRDDKGYWSQIESYIHEHSDAEFSHGICPECAEKYYPEMDLFDEDEVQG